MNLKKLSSILLLLVSFSFFAQGERMREKKEQIKALKVAYLTTELKLTPNEAEKFWAIYNTFDDKQFELRHQKMRVFMKKIDDGTLDKMNDKEANLFLEQMEKTDEELFLLRKRFILNLKGVIPAIKIIKLRKSEENFNRKLLQQYRDRGQGPIK